MVYFAASTHLIALAITLLSESCGALVVSIWSGGGWRRVKHVILAVLSVNLVTHTVFWYTLPLLPGEATMRLLAYEVAIVLIEGLAYAYFLPFRLWSSLLLSGFLNWFSYTLGVWIWQRLWHV